MYNQNVLTSSLHPIIYFIFEAELEFIKSISNILDSNRKSDD